MRKVVAIVLLLFYIISSSGVAIRAHYCCGKLRSLNLVLNSSEDKECKKKACCSDKLAFYKIDDTENASSVITFSPSFDKILYQVSYIVKSCFEPYPATCTAASVCQAMAPPPKKDINTSIRVLRL